MSQEQTKTCTNKSIWTVWLSDCCLFVQFLFCLISVRAWDHSLRHQALAPWTVSSTYFVPWLQPTSLNLTRWCGSIPTSTSWQTCFLQIMDQRLVSKRKRCSAPVDTKWIQSPAIARRSTRPWDEQGNYRTAWRSQDMGKTPKRSTSNPRKPGLLSG